jgi:2-polyprenyl-3-methyl-5-hydroxy-6-metoxy-1,4-benzoquinol methylase
MKDVVEFVKKELLIFTGLNQDEVEKLIISKKHKQEWLFWNPKSEREINWFYKTSISYLFTNAAHVLNNNIINDIPSNSTVFDFGGGSGNYSYYLVEHGCKCIYFDISFLQKRFVEYMSLKYNLPISIINYDNNYIPIYNGKVDCIIALDVIEHIPNYEKYIQYFSNITNIGGSIYIYAPFGTINDPTHLDDNLNLTNIMLKYGFKFNKNIPLNAVANCAKFIKEN